MTMGRKSLLVGPAAVGLLLLSGAAAPLYSTVPSGAVSARPAPAARKVAPVKRRGGPARVSSDECSMLALKTEIAKARMEMRELLPGVSEDPADVGEIMNSDRRATERIKRTFGGSELIKSEYTPRGECIVTVKLPLDRLRGLTRDL